MQSLLQRNKDWVESKTPEYFLQHAADQNPEFFFIGCADSRCGVEMIADAGPGEIFVHRNVANLALPHDQNFLTILHYAVSVLKVQQVVVCGHYGCGGVHAALQPCGGGPLKPWLDEIRGGLEPHQEELQGVSDKPTETSPSAVYTPRHERAVQLNVLAQCDNVNSIDVVKQSQAETGFPIVSGLVYDIRDGYCRQV